VSGADTLSNAGTATIRLRENASIDLMLVCWCFNEETRMRAKDKMNP
jgi:hypothetical protein